MSSATNGAVAERAIELTVVMPVYNEEGAIAGAIEEWSRVLDDRNMIYEFRVLNDGSRDGTAAILDSLAKLYPKLVITHKENSGHGPTILHGYRESRGKWVFQTDSDREMPPDSLSAMWDMRSSCDYIQGRRINRVAPAFRKLTTAVARWTVRIMFGAGLSDINCPYRLMKGEWLRGAANEMPEDTLTPNVVLSGWAIRDHLTLAELPVEHSHRRTGTVSIRKWKLFKFAVKAFVQVLRLQAKATGKAA